MKLIFKKDSTSKMAYIFVPDTRYGDGRGLTGLAYNTSGLSGYYWRPGATGSATTWGLASSTLGTYTSGAFKEVDATNLPGIYEIGIPNGAIATGASHCIAMFKGASNMAPVCIEIELSDIDIHDGVRAGMTALPNAVAGAAGGLSIGQNPFLKNTAFSNFLFVMYDSTNHAPVTGKTVTATRSIDGGAYAACTNSVSEVANGLYKINLAAGDLNGAIVNLRFTATGADDANITLPTVV